MCAWRDAHADFPIGHFVLTAIAFVVLYVVGTVAYAVWASNAVAGGMPILLAVLGAVFAWIAIPIIATLSWFTLAWNYRSRRPPDKRIGPARTVRLVGNEIWSVAASSVRMGMLWWWMRDPVPVKTAAPLLLVHGVGCNAGVWTGFLARLRKRGIGPVYTLTYGPPLESIETFAAEMATTIDSIIAATGAAKVIVVGHSMGGLVTRAYARRFGADRLHTVVTIGTPHRGSVHATLFPGICLAQMQPGSAWLDDLNSVATIAGVRCVGIWSWHDSMVAPQQGSRWDGADANMDVVGVGHNALLGDAAVFELAGSEIVRAAQDAVAGR